MPVGYLALVLHAHLPFVRHPEHAVHLEERWLYEALIECYLPLLDAFDRMTADGVPFALTMSVTPPLAAMLKDPFLCGRFEQHLARLDALAAQETERLEGDPAFRPVIAFYVEELARVRATWKRHRGDVVAGLVGHWDAGRIELVTSSATHCYLPGLLTTPEGIRPQLDLGVRGFEALVGRTPVGMWLPECAFHPAFEPAIARAGVGFTIVDSHGVADARPRPKHGVHAPVCSPSGVAFFARDAESSRQVWSRHEGYPGDFFYRDFYRDIGFDLPESALMGEVGPNGSRIMTGLKYFRITGPAGQSDHKEPYDRAIALARAWEHGGNFVFNRTEQVKHLAQGMPVPPIVVAPYDAELYGHWWFEGPQFLEAVFRQLPKTGGLLEPITLGGYLARHPDLPLAMPSASSWGAGGYGEVWVGHEAGWSWRHVHHATRYVCWLVQRHEAEGGVRGDALDQAIRELLLLQSSDWNFIIKTETSREYAEARIRTHTHRLRHLAYLVEKESLDEEDVRWIRDVEGRDTFLTVMAGDALRRPFLPLAE
jgi:1,4-alpha-glucan branching enzyme